MPKPLTNERESEEQGTATKDELREIIERVTPKTWKQDKARLLALPAEA
jgi:hypothetical protein